MQVTDQFHTTSMLEITRAHIFMPRTCWVPIVEITKFHSQITTTSIHTNRYIKEKTYHTHRCRSITYHRKWTFRKEHITNKPSQFTETKSSQNLNNTIRKKIFKKMHLTIQVSCPDTKPSQITHPDKFLKAGIEFQVQFKPQTPYSLQ